MVLLRPITPTLNPMGWRRYLLEPIQSAGFLRAANPNHTCYKRDAIRITARAQGDLSCEGSVVQGMPNPWRVRNTTSRVGSLRGHAPEILPVEGKDLIRLRLLGGPDVDLLLENRTHPVS